MFKSIGQIHWDYFLLLEEDLLEIFRFVEPVPSNFNTYSSKIAKLYLATCSEVDVAFKDLIMLYEGTTAEASKMKTISDYRQFAQVNCLNEFDKAQVTFTRTELTLSPWNSWWNHGHATTTNPAWWESYNRVKHLRAEHYNEASFGNLLEAFAALFIVNNCIFKKEYINGLSYELRTTKITEFVDNVQAFEPSKPMEIN